ncbi:MAG: (deoxy)nucleoside triphosphate pyrophosphohydrolase [Candidatus Tectomicrobia bacterium]
MPPASSTIKVVAGLIQQNGELLICQRRRDGAFALKWEFPGGKVEPGETYEESLHRELREELDIEAQIGPVVYRTRHDYPGAYTVELFFYYVPSYNGIVRNQAFEQVRWETPDRLAGFDFLAGDAELIVLLSQGKLPLPHTAPHPTQE